MNLPYIETVTCFFECPVYYDFSHIVI